MSYFSRTVGSRFALSLSVTYFSWKPCSAGRDDGLEVNARERLKCRSFRHVLDCVTQRPVLQTIFVTSREEVEVGLHPKEHD